MEKKNIDKFLGTGALTIVEAMQKIDLNAEGILFIVGTDNKLIGVVTDGDIRRAIIRTGDLNLQISEIMNRNPRVVLQEERGEAPSLLKQYRIHAVAVIDVTERIIDIIFDSGNRIEISKNRQNTLQRIPVVIMAGGRGTRLYPYTKILPKALIPIGDIPIVEHIMDRFRSVGVNHFYLTVNHKKNMIKSYLGEQNDDRIIFVEEDKPLGTAGSLRLIRDRMNSPFFVTNCDILIQADYDDIYEYHLKAGNAVTIVSSLKNIEVPYGVIQFKENGNVLSLEEKPQLSYFINTGLYVLNPECIDRIPENTFFHMTDLVERLLQEDQKIGMYPISEESFLDMGEWEELQRMEQKLKQTLD